MTFIIIFPLCFSRVLLPFSDMQRSESERGMQNKSGGHSVIKLGETFILPRPISEFSVIRVISLPYIFSLMSDSSHGAHIRSLVPSFKFLSRIFTLCCRHGREYIMQSLIYRPSWSRRPRGIEKRVYAKEQMESRCLSLSPLFRISFTSLWHFSQNSLRECYAEWRVRKAH